MRGAGMDVDAGLGVGPFGHHPRNQRHAEHVQGMGQAIDGDGFEAGIAEDHLVERFDRRVAVAGGLRRRAPASRRSSGICSRNRIALAWPSASKSWSGLQSCEKPASCRRARRDLRRELVVQPVDQVADVIRDVARVQSFAAAVAGIDDLLEVLDGFGNHFVVGQRAVAEVADRADLAVGLHDAAGQLGQLLFEANVGSHSVCSRRCGRADFGPLASG